MTLMLLEAAGEMEHAAKPKIYIHNNPLSEP
jgi:hypothetical protein